MANSKHVYIRLDGIKWWIAVVKDQRIPFPLCPKHDLRLSIAPTVASFQEIGKLLSCEECDRPYQIPRKLADEQTYVLNKLDSRYVKQMKFLNLDDEAVPLATTRIDASNENPYWIEARLVESKTGRRLVIYAGEKGRKDKTQIFVEPDIQRLSFDHKDRHPSDIFLKVEATFDSGHTSTISKST
jgi:hypothetical protein